MSEFINTADVIGDDEMCDQILMRTVTEYKENRITNVGQYAFYGCSALTTVDLPNVTEIGSYAFYGSKSLTTVDLPNVTEIGSYAFRDCTTLTTVNFPKVVAIHQEGLRNCSHLFAIELPEVTTLGTDALNTCAISRLCLPKYTSSGGQWNVFSGNTALKVVDLPAIATLGLNYGFSGCTNLAAVILRGSTVCSMTTATVFNNNSGITNGTGYIYVPRALVDSYKVATNWSTYASQFRALEDYTVDGTVNGRFKSYSITYNLDRVFQSSTNDFVIGDVSYQTSLRTAHDYDVVDVSITSDGVDITNAVYSNGTVNIPVVTGDIVITAKTNAPYVIVSLPIDGAESGPLPNYKLNVTAGQKLRIHYWATAGNGFLYDGRQCGSSYGYSGSDNAAKTQDITIGSDGYITFSTDAGQYSSDGNLCNNTSRYVQGKYLYVEILE